MSGSERSSVCMESDSETDVNESLEEDGNDLAPGAIGDERTEEPLSPYEYRVAALTEGDIAWFLENIKKCEPLDVTDEPGGMHQDMARQISSPQAQPPNLPTDATDAFGKLYFEGEEDQGTLSSWYVRIAANTDKETIQTLLEKVFEVMSSTSQPLRIHCIDYNQWPTDDHRPSPHFDTIVNKMQKDLQSMCLKTAGIVLTWSGLANGSLMHSVLGKINRDTNITNLATIATPPWNGLDLEVQEQLKVKGVDVHLAGGEAAPDPQARQRQSLGAHVSQYASHFLLLDDEATTISGFTSESHLTNVRHFHQDMILSMENSEKKKSVEMPVVCVLINGHHDALKMVVFALDKNIPVLIVKGTGGYADIIAEVYLNAEQETTKYRDEQDQVRTRITKKAGDVGQKYLKNEDTKHPLLKEIFKRLDLLTVYIPGYSIQTLDSVFFEALLKYNQQNKFRELVDIMKKNKKRTLQYSISQTERANFLDSVELQMDYFIEAVKQNRIEVVKIFLDGLKITEKFNAHFHMGRVLRLYTKNTKQTEKLVDFRNRLKDLLMKLTFFPLRCASEGCITCDVDSTCQTEESQLAMQRTCLHPIQELFLWALLENQVEMAMVFWIQCDDKIAAALVARKVLKSLWSLSKKFNDPEDIWQMNQNVQKFQNLAIETLRNCHNMDEMETELLLTKPCPWWGGVSILQLAIMSNNREFMTQTACKNIMTRIWKAQPPSDPEMPQRPCRLVDIEPESSGCSCAGIKCSPRAQYVINFVMQVIFLGLFSYGVLSDLGHGLTNIFIVLIVWVAAIFLEELRQFSSKNPVLSDGDFGAYGRRLAKVKNYFSQNWNIIDATTIVFFGGGMLVFAPVEGLHIAGRVLLSIDVFLFFMRMFQMLMVFDELGLMLIMVYKMVKDTKNFMIILLIFVLAYAVASESLLYPENDLNWQRLFHLPRKAYWQVFGELSLDEIEIRDEDSCSLNQSKHFGYDTPHCPTNYGSYIAPVLLGLHVMITNVLLLNLLIARFGVTFNKVHDEAQEYQSWHRCQIITEYYNRTSLPPPFNILHIIFFVLRFCFLKIGHCVRRLCCCCRRGGERGPDNAIEMRSMVQGAQNLNGPIGDQQALLPDGNVKAKRSADKRSVDIVWMSRLPARFERHVECYHVEISKKTESQIPPVPDTFSVSKNTSRPGGEQKLTVWNLNPKADYTIKLQDRPVNIDETKCSNSDDLVHMRNFEEEQALWVCRPEEEEETLKPEHLQTQTDALTNVMEKVTKEMKEVTKEMKERHIGLTHSVNATMSEQNKSLKRKLKDYTQKNHSNLQKIDENLNKIKNIVKEKNQQDQESLKKELKTKCEELENKVESLEKVEKERVGEMARMLSDKDSVISDLKDSLKEQQKAVETVLRNQEEQQEKVQQQLQAFKLEQQKIVEAVLQNHEEQQQEMQQHLQAFKQEQQKALEQAMSQQTQSLCEVLLAMQGKPSLPADAGDGDGSTQ